MNGRGIERDPTAAVYWYGLAADQGDEWACYLLGLCFRDGDGVEQNVKLAKYCFAKAAAKKVKEACRALEQLATANKVTGRK